MRAFFLFLFGAFFLSWCVWTEPGVRLVSKISTALGAGPPALELDFNQLNGEMTEADLQARYPNLEWFCSDVSGSRDEPGWRSCETKVLLVNGVKAISIVSYTQNGKLDIVYVEHVPDSFAQLVFKLNDQYPRSGNTGYFKSQHLALKPGDALYTSLLSGEARDYWGWKTKDGMIVSSNHRRNFRNNVIAFWASNQHMSGYSNMTMDSKPSYKQVIRSPALAEP